MTVSLSSLAGSVARGTVRLGAGAIEIRALTGAESDAIARAVPPPLAPAGGSAAPAARRAFEAQQREWLITTRCCELAVAADLAPEGKEGGGGWGACASDDERRAFARAVTAELRGSFTSHQLVAAWTAVDELCAADTSEPKALVESLLEAIGRGVDESCGTREQRQAAGLLMGRVREVLEDRLRTVPGLEKALGN